MDEDYPVPVDGVVEYQHFFVKGNFKEDRWIRAAEIRNVDPSVVHHVIVYIQPPPTFRGSPFGIRMSAEARPATPEREAEIKGVKVNRGRLGFFLTATGPGERGTVFPEGSGMRIPAGSNFIFQVHYTPRGKAVKDRAKIGLFYLKDLPQNEVRTASAQNGQFTIPAGEANHRVEDRKSTRLNSSHIQKSRMPSSA